MTLYFILPVTRTYLSKSKREFTVSILVVWEANRIFLNFQTCQTLFVSNLLSFILRVSQNTKDIRSMRLRNRQHQLQKSNLGNVFDLLIYPNFKKLIPQAKDTEF